MAEQRVPPDFTPTLDALRERGAQRIDPVRWRLIESLRQRADAHQGMARQLLDDKLATLLQTMGDALDRAEAQAGDGAQPMAQSARRPGELAALVAHIAQCKPGGAKPMDAIPQAGASPKGGANARDDSPVDTKTLQFFRRTWSRLSADQRLAQSRSSLPDNAGPLNSQHLVHRSLNVMRELSPEYFDLFISHVDTLLWLERANEQAAREVGLPLRAKGGRKSTGAKRG